MEGVLLVGGMLADKACTSTLCSTLRSSLGTYPWDKALYGGSLCLFGVLCSQCHLQSEFTSIP